MDGNGDKKYRIGISSIIILMISAIFADLLSLIPLVGDIVGPIYWIVAGIFFWQAGLGIVNWKTLAPELISLVGELIPAIQALPTIIVCTAIIIILSRIEDKTGISLNPINKGVRLPIKQQPLNKGGKRLPNSGNN